MSGEVLGGIVVGLNFASGTCEQQQSCHRGTSAETVGVRANDQVIEMARQLVMM